MGDRVKFQQRSDMMLEIIQPELRSARLQQGKVARALRVSGSAVISDKPMSFPEIFKPRANVTPNQLAIITDQ